MRYTRRRWDVTVLLMGLVLGLGLAAMEFLIGGIWPKVAAFPVILIPFVLFRFKIPKEGFQSPEIGKLPREQRYLYIWCLIMSIAGLCAIPFYVRSRQHWWWGAAAGVALMVFTLILALRVDRARKALLKETGDTLKSTPRHPSD
jgi:peptidoglycan/LPS O-acetylase OafA/YrhL